MSIEIVFDQRLDVFRHHFGHDAIVPGVMLLDHYVAHRVNTASDRVAVALSDVRFQQFVRPGQTVKFTSSHSGEVRAERDGSTCCSFKLDTDRTWPLARTATSTPSSRRTVHIDALRSPEYWFLDDKIEVDQGGRSAWCNIDLTAVERQHDYLAEIPRWRLLVLIECAGNLALALQHLAEPGEARPRYVFVRFDEIIYRMDCTLWASQQSVITRVKRFGTLIVWEATIFNALSTQITIRGAVSHGEKA